MKIATLGTLLLAIFLPCILGDESCACTFPDYLSGDITIISRYSSRSFTEHNQWYMSFVDQLFRWTIEETIEVLDLKLSRLYTSSPPPDGGCSSFNITTNNTIYSLVVPPPCVSSDATSTTLGNGNLLYKHSRNPAISVEYRVKVTGGRTCKPLEIHIEDTESPTLHQSFIFTNIREDTAKDIGFYTDDLSQCHDVGDITLA